MHNKNLNEITNCHSGLDPESRNEMLNQVQHDSREGGEQGRSMVEMLGVLAVIGVLTIIGITGFRYALNKHYANQTVERLMRRAVVVAGQANFGQNLSLHEFDENDGEYPISRTLKSTSESFTMRVDNVPQEVCQQIVGMEWRLAKIIPENCSDETMEFMFLNDLTDCTDCQPETFPCEDYGTECGKCSVVKGYTRNDDDCTDDNKRYCVMGRCEVCPAGQTIYNGNCTSCTDINYTLTSSAECHKCVDANNKPSHFQPGDRCMQCSDTNYSSHYATTLEECGRCPNRCLRRDNKHCGIPGIQHSDAGNNFVGYALDTENNSGYCVCAEGYHPNNIGTCLACDEINYTQMDATECHKCVDANNNTTHFQPGDRCMQCSDTDWSFEYVTNLEECGHCSNRCLRLDNKHCGIPGEVGHNTSFVGYALDTENNSGYCVCAEGYHMVNNSCVAD